MRAGMVGFGILCLLLGWAGQLRADEQTEARALLDKAVQAAGGREKLGKFQGLTWKGKGTFQVNEGQVALTSEWSVQGMNQYRWDGQAEVNGNTISGVLILNGDKGWIKPGNNPAAEMPKETFTFLRDEFQAVRLAQNLVFLQDQSLQLTPLGELKIDDRPAVGVKVTRKDRPDVDLFFDKETMLPVKCGLRIQEPQGARQEALHEFFFSDYQEVEGLQLFGKLVLKRDGQEIMTTELTEAKPQENVGDSLFDKP
ncbi:MAG: hypothetical protein JO112_18430 [Planctomycetes bacterium]|nr:hypothetical protein [Planctomycetota bacterium]